MDHGESVRRHSLDLDLCGSIAFRRFTGDNTQIPVLKMFMVVVIGFNSNTFCVVIMLCGKGTRRAGKGAWWLN